MVGDGFGNYSVLAGMSRRWRHPCGGLGSSRSAVATTSTSAPSRSLGGSPGADADSGPYRRHLKDGSCAGFIVGGCQVWFPPSAS
jgi:hypothetical protein